MKCVQTIIKKNVRKYQDIKKIFVNYENLINANIIKTRLCSFVYLWSVSMCY